MCIRPHPDKGDSAHGNCFGSAVADGGARGWQVAYDLPFVPSESARGYPFRFPFVKWSLSFISRFPPGFRNAKVLVELCSRAPRRIGGVGEGFTDSNVDTVYPCVGWLAGVFEIGVTIATRSEGTQELDGEDVEGDAFSPGLGHEASAGVVPISSDEKSAVFVYKVGPDECEVTFTHVDVEGYNL